VLGFWPFQVLKNKKKYKCEKMPKTQHFYGVVVAVLKSEFNKKYGLLISFYF
jgi:hypothetical protein